MTSQQPDEQTQEIIQEVPNDSRNVTSDDLAVLMTRGVLVTLYISRPRGMAQLEPEDLGLPPMTLEERRAFRKKVTLGSKNLLPDDWSDSLRRAEKNARRYLRQRAYQVPGGWFVPVTAYRDWKAMNAQAEAVFFALRDELLSRWDALQGQLRLEFYVAAVAAYRVASAMFPSVQEKGQDAFVENYMTRILAQVPTQAQLGKDFQYLVTLSYVDATAASKDARAEQERDEAEREMLADLKRANEERQAETARTFLNEVIGQMNALVWEMSSEVLGSLEDKGKFDQGQTRTMTAFVKNATALNFYGDDDLAQIIAKVRQIVETPIEMRDPRTVTDALKAIATIAGFKLREIGRSPKNAREIGVPSNLTEVSLKAAREVLAGSKVEVEAVTRKGRKGTTVLEGLTETVDPTPGSVILDTAIEPSEMTLIAPVEPDDLADLKPIMRRGRKLQAVEV